MHGLSGARLWPVLGGLVAMLLVWLAALLVFPGVLDSLQQRAEDLTMRAARPWVTVPANRPRIVIADIDRATLERIGPWPWRRSRFAALVSRLAGANPSVITTDILFSGADTRSPAALARTLAALTGRPEIATLSKQLEDDDPMLAQALRQRPSALGFALDPAGGKPPPAPPIIVRGQGGLPGIWSSEGAETPAPLLAAAAAGFGAAALPGDEDGTVRRAPALVAAAGTVLPGLALETVRLSLGEVAYRADPGKRQLLIGALAVPLTPDAMLRLRPADARDDIRVIPAFEILDAARQLDGLDGAIVLIGGSAPELGGLRAAAASPVTPSVRIQAGLVRQMLDGYVPVAWPPDAWRASTNRVAGTSVAVLLASLAAGTLATVIAALATPLWGAMTVAALTVAAVFATVLAAAQGVLLPLVAPMLTALAAYGAAGLAAFALQARREKRIRRHFEQRLAPQIVSVLARNPAMLKLKGERREVTVVFTDIEGFTSLTRRADPEVLLALLDAYFEGISQIMVKHGGMIDKFVGDAVLALFNVPLDLPGHPQAAVTAALEIAQWTDTFRSAPEAFGLMLGRTRIGVETGDVIVGDVGLSSRLDYTAYGDAVNAAARLEAANKELGSQICIGPGTAGRCPPDWLKPNGMLKLRGFDESMETYSPA